MIKKMKISVHKKLSSGTIVLEIEGRNEKEALAKALFYTQPEYCSLCKSNNVIWTYNKAKDAEGGGMFTYIKRKCLKCKAESVAGEYKDGGLFWKNFEMPKYKNNDGISEEEDLGMPADETDTPNVAYDHQRGTNSQIKNEEIPVIDADEEDTNVKDEQ